MWSNDVVADEDPDDVSPWTRDDWVPESSVPEATAFEHTARQRSRPARPAAAAPPRGGAEVEGGAAVDGGDVDEASPRSSVGRTLVAGAVVAALVIGSAGALLRNRDTASEASPAGTSVVETPAISGTSTPTRTPTSTPTRTPTSTPTTVTRATVLLGGGDVVGVPEPIPTLVVGEPATWAEYIVAVPENLAALAPTEVVTLSQSGVVSVTEFPGGRTRSVDVSSVGAQLQITVGNGTIVVFDSTTLLQIRDGEPVVESTLSDGIIFVQPWTGTDDFVVTTPATGPSTPERNWVLRPDGTLDTLDNRFVDETSFFSRVFSPDGDALFNAPGGVYAVAPDGATRRISTGTLIATGRRHWAIEECDETLRCAYSIIEWDTGTVTPALLDAVAQFGYVDLATFISPDGRSIVFRADSDGAGRRQILDVESGTSLAAGRINQFVEPDAWATDSSGVFITDRFLQFIERATGTVTEIPGLDRIRTVATGSFSQER